MDHCYPLVVLTKGHSKPCHFPLCNVKSRGSFHYPQVYWGNTSHLCWAWLAGFKLGYHEQGGYLGTQTTQRGATFSLITFIDSLNIILQQHTWLQVTSTTHIDSIDRCDTSETQAWTSLTLHRHLCIKNINIIIRDGNNSININMLSSYCNIISYVNYYQHKNHEISLNNIMFNHNCIISLYHYVNIVTCHYDMCRHNKW